jgi:hypothetical protein
VRATHPIPQKAPDEQGLLFFPPIFVELTILSAKNRFFRRYSDDTLTAKND